MDYGMDYGGGDH